MQLEEIVDLVNSHSDLQLSRENYVGFWSHRLPQADQIATKRNSNQTHIAVTGDRMTMFPVVTSARYEEDPANNVDEKSRFVLRLAVDIYRDNLASLVSGLIANPLTDGIKTQDDLKTDLKKIQTLQAVVSTHTECRFNIRASTGQRQIELSRIRSDGEMFLLLRRLLPAGSNLIFLRRSSGELEVVGLPATEGVDPSGLLIPPASDRIVVNGHEIVSGSEPVEADDDLWALLGRRTNVVLYGPPGTGKTRTANSIIDRWAAENGDESVFSVTFHPSYSYEDFVLGFRPDPDEPSTFVLTDGLLIAAIDQANSYLADGSGRAVLIAIDEINRADVARVFGELITYIEPDKRNRTFRLAQQPNRKLSIPPNLSFLGTMNTADKSVSLLDVALRRRFAFVEMGPDYTVFAKNPGWLSEIEGIDIGKLLLGVNQRLRVIGVSDDRSIGHSLLSVNADSLAPLSDLMSRFELDVFPLVEEYCYFDRSQMKEVFGALVDSTGRWLQPASPKDVVAELKRIVGLEDSDLAVNQRLDFVEDGDALEP
jgi:hypothetical protein